MAVDSKRRIYYTTNSFAPDSPQETAFGVLTPRGGGPDGGYSNDLVCNSNERCEIRGIEVYEDKSKGNDVTVYLTRNHCLQVYKNNVLTEKGVGRLQHKGSDVNYFNDPNGIRRYNNWIYVCDSNNHRIQIFTHNFDRSGTKVIRRNSANFGTILDHPEDLDFDEHGNLYVLNSNNAFVVKFACSDNLKYDNLVQWKVSLSAKANVIWPTSLRVFRDAWSSYLCILDHTSWCFDVYSIDAQTLVRRVHISRRGVGGDFGRLEVTVSSAKDNSAVVADVCFVPPAEGLASNRTRPLGLAVDCDGFLYVSCCDVNEIQIFD